MKPQGWIVMVGDAIQGYKLYGTFATKHDAQQFIPPDAPLHGHMVIYQLLRPRL